MAAALPTSDVDGVLATAPELQVVTFGSAAGNGAFAILGATWTQRAMHRDAQWARAPKLAPKDDNAQCAWEYYIEFTLRRAFLANAQESRSAQKAWRDTLKSVTKDWGDRGAESMLSEAAFGDAQAAPQSSASFCARHPNLVEDVTLGPVEEGRGASGGFRRDTKGGIQFRMTLLSSVKRLRYGDKAFAVDRKSNPFHEMWRWALNEELRVQEPSLAAPRTSARPRSGCWSALELRRAGAVPDDAERRLFDARHAYLGEKGEEGDAPAVSSPLEAAEDDPKKLQALHRERYGSPEDRASGVYAKTNRLSEAQLYDPFPCVTEAGIILEPERRPLRLRQHAPLPTNAVLLQRELDLAAGGARKLISKPYMTVLNTLRATERRFEAAEFGLEQVPFDPELDGAPFPLRDHVSGLVQTLRVDNLGPRGVPETPTRTLWAAMVSVRMNADMMEMQQYGDELSKPGNPAHHAFDTPTLCARSLLEPQGALETDLPNATDAAVPLLSPAPAGHEVHLLDEADRETFRGLVPNATYADERARVQAVVDELKAKPIFVESVLSRNAQRWVVGSSWDTFGARFSEWSLNHGKSKKAVDEGMANEALHAKVRTLLVDLRARVVQRALLGAAVGEESYEDKLKACTADPIVYSLAQYGALGIDTTKQGCVDAEKYYVLPKLPDELPGGPGSCTPTYRDDGNDRADRDLRRFRDDTGSGRTVDLYSYGEKKKKTPEMDAKAIVEYRAANGRRRGPRWPCTRGASCVPRLIADAAGGCPQSLPEGIMQALQYTWDRTEKVVIPETGDLPAPLHVLRRRSACARASARRCGRARRRPGCAAGGRVSRLCASDGRRDGRRDGRQGDRQERARRLDRGADGPSARTRRGAPPSRRSARLLRELRKMGPKKLEEANAGA